MKKYNILLYIIVTGAFFVLVCREVSYTNNDPRGTLLVSQALTNRGTIKLDYYGPDVLRHYGWCMYKKENGHYYYFFPLGTSLAALPAVAAANAFGIDMVDCEAETQWAIVTIVAALTMLMLFKIARLYLPFIESMLLQCCAGSGPLLPEPPARHSGRITLQRFLPFWLSMPLFHPLTAAISGCGLCWPFTCFRHTCAGRPWPCWHRACLCFLYVRKKTVALKTALLLAFCLAFFMLFNFSEFGQILPDYYLPQRLEGGRFLTALYGNIFSPARGLFVFSPFFLLSLFIDSYNAQQRKKWTPLSCSLRWYGRSFI